MAITQEKGKDSSSCTSLEDHQMGGMATTKADLATISYAPATIQAHLLTVHGAAVEDVTEAAIGPECRGSNDPN